MPTFLSDDNGLIEDEEEDMVVDVDKEEEVEVIITTSIREAIKHLMVVEEQKKEEEATIQGQMRGGMINLMLNVTIVINLAIMLGNVMTKRCMSMNKSILLTSKMMKSLLYYLLLKMIREMKKAHGTWIMEQAITCVEIN